mmetsp:Transcript_26985/g.41382  ORF Transcript_26985/g.41382 Transcript_26985/m.41382 type:complete len:86 (+) Transcript_26985:41-298(+)
MVPFFDQSVCYLVFLMMVLCKNVETVARQSEKMSSPGDRYRINALIFGRRRRVDDDTLSLYALLSQQKDTSSSCFLSSNPILCCF